MRGFRPGSKSASGSGAPKVLDLFSGAGGMALGFQAAGARTIGAVEIDPASAATFRQAFEGDGPVVSGGSPGVAGPGGDITRIDPCELLERLPAWPDIVVGGPPCQGFSRIGRAKQRSLVTEQDYTSRGARDPDRNELYDRFLDVVLAARPKAFVMENVPGLRDHLGIDMAMRIAEDAERRCEYLYNVRYFILNAAWYGVPQERWRIFFVGLRSDLGPSAVPTAPPRTHEVREEFPEGTSLPEDPRMLWGRQIPCAPRALPTVTTLDALGDLPRLVGHLSGQKPAEARLPLRRKPSPWALALREWPDRPATDLVSGNRYRWTPRDFKIFEGMAHGDRYPRALAIAQQLFQEHLAGLRAVGAGPRAGTPKYEALRRAFIPPYRNDAFEDKWAKLRPDAPSWTLTAHLSKDSYSHIHYDSAQARTITVREAARLQSFPDSFEFSGNFGEQFQQIGNAVPPLLAKAIAANLLDQLERLDQQTLVHSADAVEPNRSPHLSV
jgi:DNA (cytosine-5)-methyltransferase 1